MMNKPNIYLLSIGINQYAAETTSDLDGCEKDVTSFQQLLLDCELVTKANCKLLLSNEATREGIIKSIRTHFSQLSAGDIAVLHYSGHGSTEATDQAFIQAGYEPPGGRNETLVCYDSRTDGIFDIADKELRMLVAEVQEGKENCSFIALLDCCHSGSMLKDTNWQARTTPSQMIQRSLVDYLEGQYRQMLDRDGTILIPSINYMSLSACSPKEHALEIEGGGVFTTALITVLKEHRLQLSYADLYLQVRQIVHINSTSRQHPYIEYAGEANPYHFFLQHRMSSDILLPKLEKRGPEWITNVGAIHGIELQPRTNPILPIYQKANWNSPLGYASIKQVNIEETLITPTWQDATPVDSKDLHIAIWARQLPIRLNADKEATHSSIDLMNVLESTLIKSQFIVHPNALYELYSQANQLLLYRNGPSQKELLIGLKEQSVKAHNWLRQQLQMIAKWESLQQLTTPKYSKVASEAISFSFSYWNRHCPKKTYTLDRAAQDNSAIQTIIIPFNSEEGAVFYQFEVEHQHSHLHGLYFYLIHLDRKYQIKQKYEYYNENLMSGVRQSLYNSEELGKGLGISDPQLSSVEDTFILIASETKLTTPYYFHQVGFSNAFGKVVNLENFEEAKGESSNGVSLQNDWVMKKITVRLVQAK